MKSFELYEPTTVREAVDTLNRLGSGGKYTVFGRVIEGLDVIDKLAAVQTRANKPLQPIYMTMELKSVAKKEITEKYGYSYSESQ